MRSDYVTVGEIQEAVKDITRQGIYFYEAKGLIKPAIETEKIKLYTRDTIDRVKRIRELAQDHKLDYIKRLLDREGAK
jgi:DNA-binding transcriptional MerR regulator